ncbi:MAG: sulfurtransferase [Synechococcaceae cyanobacterium SM2_3_60]|nr:sulfurtransferase [Synechococcaceae cyanobacterium SM2_3_60]
MAKQHNPGFVALVNTARAQVRECTIDDLKARHDQGETFHLVDVREESEWAQGHLPRAIHIGKGVIERDIETAIPDKNAEIILYCGGGYRSALAAHAVQHMGYTQVISLAGGWRAWTEAGYPVEG